MKPIYTSNSLLQNDLFCTTVNKSKIARFYHTSLTNNFFDICIFNNFGNPFWRQAVSVTGFKCLLAQGGIMGELLL